MYLKNVTKKYGKTTVLEKFDLEIEEGKITCLLGESGAGKTTILNILAGLTPCEGEVQTERCSYIFQESQLLPNLTVEDNLKFVLDKKDWGRIGEMLEKVGLKGKEKRYPSTLSGGEQKRVSIARAFLYPHKVLLMDEPFSSLDLSIKRELLSLVVKLWQEKGNTVVFVTHDVHEAALLAHRAVVLKKGKVVSDFTIPDPLPRDFLSTPPVEISLVNALL